MARIRGIAKAKRTLVREPLGSREGGMPQSLSVDEHLRFAARPVPGGWDADDVAEAAEAAREVVRQRLTEALPQGATAPQRRMLERGARHAAESGVWLSAADGGSVHLVDGDAGRPVTYPDGEPVAFSLRELAAIAADRRRAEPESPAGPYNRLSGEGR